MRRRDGNRVRLSWLVGDSHPPDRRAGASAVTSHLRASSMSDPSLPAAIVAAEALPRTKPSNYPEPFASRMAGRLKRPLGDVFGLTQFGVNLTRLAPNAS